MASLRMLVETAAARILFREAEVTEIRALGPRFRLVDARGDALRGVAWTPGDKVQVHLAGEGMRTYTPFAWDAARGMMKFLLYVHGDPPATPGARWASRLAPADRWSFFGPRRSIAFPDLEPDAVFFGDETSFAAAAALRAVHAKAALVFEVDDAGAARPALAELGLEDATLVARAGEAHVDALARAIAGALATRPGAKVTLTGKAQTIQALRARLSDHRPRPIGKVKAYWSVGKAGLD